LVQPDTLVVTGLGVGPSNVEVLLLDLVEQSSVIVLRSSQTALDGDHFTLKTLFVLVVVQFERVRISNELLETLNFAGETTALVLKIIDLL
jgi:hypothetical protein